MVSMFAVYIFFAAFIVDREARVFFVLYIWIAHAPSLFDVVADHEVIAALLDVFHGLLQCFDICLTGLSECHVWRQTECVSHLGGASYVQIEDGAKEKTWYCVM